MPDIQDAESLRRAEFLSALALSIAVDVLPGPISIFFPAVWADGRYQVTMTFATRDELMRWQAALSVASLRIVVDYHGTAYGLLAGYFQGALCSLSASWRARPEDRRGDAPTSLRAQHVPICDADEEV